ncbi:MAG: starch-binding protein [Clostridia bacterium]|nr:starch-binding protein [Clostridia bacterium]
MKNTNKILALILAIMTIVMSLSMLTVSAADSTRVYCDNEAGWDVVYCYCWDANGKNNGNWPGTKMTYDESLGLWYFDIPAGFENCIFNGGNGKPQSADLKTPTDDNVVYNNSFKSWSALGGEAIEPDKMTIYVNNTKGWTNVYCYLATANWGAEATWPGVKMNYDESLGLWYYEFYVGYYYCIFSDGTNQTGDLLVPTDGAVVLDNTTEKWGVLPGECEHTPTGEGTVIKASTCTENGEISYVCSKCGKTYNVTVVAEGHNYEGANAVCSCGAKATFTVAGDNTDLFGTEWDAGNTKNSMTFNEETQTWSISYVNGSSSEIWPQFKVCLDNGWKTCWGGAAAGQADSDNAWVSVPAGHTLTITFDYVNKKLSMRTEAAHVHSYEGTVTTPASCTTTGIMTYVCPCGDEYTEVIPETHDFKYAGGACKICYQVADPDFHHNTLVLGENTVIVDDHHLVDWTGHKQPYQFTTFTIDEAGHYYFTCDRVIGFTIFTVEINSEGADFRPVEGTSWKTYVVGSEGFGAELEPGTYYVGMIYYGDSYAGENQLGEYKVTLNRTHEHIWTDATCTDPKTCTVCGKTEGDALGHDYVDGACSRCDAEDPNYVDDPVVDDPIVDDPVVDEPTELTLWEKIVAWFMSLIETILGLFKKA